MLLLLLLPSLLVEELTDDVLVEGGGWLVLRRGWDRLCRVTIVEQVLGDQ